MATQAHGTVLPPEGIEDMITLDNLNEETMLNNLNIRYTKNLIYVRASFFIAVKPLTNFLLDLKLL